MVISLVIVITSLSVCISKPYVAYLKYTQFYFFNDCLFIGHYVQSEHKGNGQCPLWQSPFIRVSAPWYAHQLSGCVPPIRSLSHSHIGHEGSLGRWEFSWTPCQPEGNQGSINYKEEMVTGAATPSVCHTLSIALIKLHWNVLSLSPLPSELIALGKQRHPVILVFSVSTWHTAWHKIFNKHNTTLPHPMQQTILNLDLHVGIEASSFLFYPMVAFIFP